MKCDVSIDLYNTIIYSRYTQEFTNYMNKWLFSYCEQHVFSFLNLWTFKEKQSKQSSQHTQLQNNFQKKISKGRNQSRFFFLTKGLNAYF